MPGLLQMLTILAQTLGPLYQVTRGKHRIDDHILKKFALQVMNRV
jgi:hypothetical protein